MTPTEALADALSDQKHAVIFEPDDFAAHIAAALDALGFTVARTQDAADGEALRLLREAANDKGLMPVLCLVSVLVDATESVSGSAEKLRAAIEATR